MKILFLHLSDLHIKDEKAYCEFQIKKMVDSLRVAGKVDHMFIICSGDIAFSGAQEQYNVAYGILKKIFTQLKKEKIFTERVEVICVPGNHDIAYEEPPRTAKELNEIYKNWSYEKLLMSEYDKQIQFFKFGKRLGCFKKDSLFEQKKVNLGEFSIEINMINTGIFSLRDDEDKGLHYIDQNSINTLNTPTGADFVVSVMHHSYDWYLDQQKEQLEKALLCKSSLIFMGHEHRIGTKQYSYDKRIAAFIHAGGSLCNNDDWTKSEYEFGVLDTNTYSYDLYLNKWNEKEQQYQPKDHINTNLVKKASEEKKLTVLDDYYSKILNDSRRNLSDNFTDYFVFPRIETEAYGETQSKEFLTMDAFLAEISAQKRVLITGANDSGKTFLLKALFLKLVQEKCVLYCDIDTIKNKESKKIVRSNFEDVYGDDYASFVRFQQLPPENKVLIIDDIDQIRQRDFERYISGLSNEFGLMIFVTNKVIDLDMLERMKNALKTDTAITKYKISPFYSDKRKELIRKVVAIKHIKDPSLDIDGITEKLCTSIKLQKKFISLTPDFIIDFVDYYCNNIGTISNSDSTVFSKVFEANITAMISPFSSGILTTDKIYRLLSMIAYHIHFNKKYPISENDILEIVKIYNGDDGEVSLTGFFDIILKSKMIISSNGGYKFSNRNHLAYFVAREINFLYNVSGEEGDLVYLLNNACFGINADILMFISYITDNPRILRFLLNTTKRITGDWNEFNFNSNLPEFLNMTKALEVSSPNETIRNNAEQKEISDEKDMSSKLATIDIYDYNEDDSNTIVNQIIRALSLLIIISKCLPSFEHNMTPDMRKDFVNEIYQLPNKIYYMWAQYTDKNYNQIIEEIKKDSPIEYEKSEKPGELSELQVQFQTVAIALLLEIYNVSAAHATKDNSFLFLDKYDRGENETYNIQHLMMLEKQQNPEAFVEKAIDIFENSKSLLPKSLIKNVVVHAMIYMKSLDYKKRDKLKSTFFKARHEQQRLLVKRAKDGSNKD